MPPAGLRLLPRGPLPALGQFNTVDGDLHRAWARLLPAAGTLCVLHQDDGSKRRNWADGEATGAAVASFLFPRPILVHTRTWIIRMGTENERCQTARRPSAGEESVTARYMAASAAAGRPDQLVYTQVRRATVQFLKNPERRCPASSTDRPAPPRATHPLNRYARGPARGRR